MTSNYPIQDFAKSAEDRQALKNRVYSIKMTVPILDFATTEQVPLALRFKPYLLRPKFQLGGEALLGLYTRHFPAPFAIPPFDDNSVIQNLA